MAVKNNWRNYRNILCVRLDNAGDVVMTTPALRALKEACPERKITLLTSPPGARIAGLIPEVDRCIVYGAPWVKATAPCRDARGEYALIRALKRERFDAAVIFTVYSQSPLPAAFLCYMSGIPERLAHCRENPYQLLTRWVPDPEPKEYVRHEVERQLDLVASVGCSPRRDGLSLKVPDAAYRRLERILAREGVDPQRPRIVLHCGSSAPSRRYPKGSFAKAARLLFKETGFTLLFSGTQEEREDIESIRAQAAVPSVSLAGKMNLEELAALLSRSALLISNNTGPVHIAAALGTRVVDLYALTNPQHTPWKVASRVLSHDVPCRYCYKSICPEGHQRCLAMVPAEAVVHAAKELLCEQNYFASFDKSFAVDVQAGNSPRSAMAREGI